MISLSLEYGCPVLRRDGQLIQALEHAGLARCWLIAGRAPHAGERMPVPLAVADRLILADCEARRRHDLIGPTRPTWLERI